MKGINKHTPTVFDGDPPERILAKYPNARIKLIQARIRHEWSRPELGKRIGISRGIVFKVETGATNTSLPVMLRWAKIINAPLDIFSPERQPRHDSERDEAIWGEVQAGASLRKVGRRYGLSGERVRQIANRRSRAKAADEPVAAE